MTVLMLSPTRPGYSFIVLKTELVKTDAVEVTEEEKEKAIWSAIALELKLPVTVVRKSYRQLFAVEVSGPVKVITIEA